MSEYTPATWEIKAEYMARLLLDGVPPEKSGSAFDRWLAQRDEKHEAAIASPAPEVTVEDVARINEALWDFAGDLLDAWGITDENPPSLVEDFRDRITARFTITERKEQ